MKDLSLSIIIPCHNSAANIGFTIQKITTYLPEGGNIEIILVENGSTDNTFDELKSLLAKKIALTIIVARSNTGLGCALRKGVELATKENILFLADDLPFGMSELCYLAENECESAEYIIFSKYKNRFFLRRSFFRSISGYVFLIIRELLLQTRVLDSQGTFLACNDVAKKIYSDSKQDGYLITTEAILVARKLGLVVKEIPVLEILPDVRKSNIALRDVQKMFQSLIGLWWEIRRL
jgi:dolichyl-phosphate beta-glucosyltransferase